MGKNKYTCYLINNFKNFIHKKQKGIFMKKCTLFTTLLLTACCMGLYGDGDGDKNQPDNRDWKTRMHDGAKSGIEKVPEISLTSATKIIVEESVKKLYNGLLKKISCSRSKNNLEILEKGAKEIKHLKELGASRSTIAKKKAEIIKKYLKNNKNKKK